jgi:hypothetical protein
MKNAFLTSFSILMLSAFSNTSSFAADPVIQKLVGTWKSECYADLGSGYQDQITISEDLTITTTTLFFGRDFTCTQHDSSFDSGPYFQKYSILSETPTQVTLSRPGGETRQGAVSTWSTDVLTLIDQSRFNFLKDRVFWKMSDGTIQSDVQAFTGWYKSDFQRVSP